MRYTAEPNSEPNFNAILDAAQKQPVYVEREHKEFAVVISARQYELWRKSALEDFDRFCDEMSDRAAARGLTEEKLNELLADE